MTNTYDTTSFPLGSTQPKVLYNNASNFDEAMNSESPAFIDRFGKRRQTWAGSEAQWQQLLQNSGFEPIHLVYVDGSPLVVARPTQLIDRAGTSYRIKTPATFPVTLTGTWATDLSKVVEVGDVALRSDLGNAVNLTLGAAVVGRAIQVVENIAALKTLDKTKPSTAAFVRNVGVTYTIDPADTTSPGDDGMVVVGADGARWKPFNRGEVAITLYGAVGDGVTDCTDAIQRCFDFAMPNGYRVHIPTGVFVVSDTVTLDNLSANNTGGTQSISFRTGIRGDGQGSSILKWTGGATKGCLKIITGGSSRTLFENFSLLQTGASKVGYGLHVLQTAHAEFKNIAAEGFELGGKSEDSFSIVWNTCRFCENVKGFDATVDFGSRPNDFAFNNCNFINNTELGASFQEPTTLVFKGGSFEGNGGMVAGQGGLRVNGNPVEGVAGLCASGVYFEGNGGSFDLGIYDSPAAGIHSVSGCTFNRINNVKYTSANIALYKNNTTWRTLLSVHGNGFAGFNSYVASAARKYIQVVSPVDNFYVVDIGLNLWGNSIEIPDIAGGMANTKQISVAARFNGTTGTVDGITSNLASFVKNGVADYTINYAKGLNNAKNVIMMGPAETFMVTEIFSESAVHIRIRTKNQAGAYADFSNISISVYGEDGGI